MEIREIYFELAVRGLLQLLNIWFVSGYMRAVPPTDKHTSPVIFWSRAQTALTKE